MKKSFCHSVVFIFLSTAAHSQTIPAGSDIVYGVNATSGSTQDWGTIDPSTGTFTSIAQISPTGLGWPLGDIGSQPDPINGYVFTRQTNAALGGNPTDILAIKKSDGITQWLGLSGDDMVVGYDTKTNKLIYRDSSSGNKLKTYDVNDGTTGTISTSFASGQSSWQAGGIGAVNSFGRTAFQLKPGSTSTLYKINLDTGAESIATINGYVVSIAWDSKKQKLYGIYDSDGMSGYRVGEINTEDGTLTNISAANSVSGMANYVQMIAPNDQRYYVQENGGVIRVISLEDGSSLGTFTAPLRIMPIGAVVMGTNDTSEETITFDISDVDSKIIKKGTNEVTYTGTNSSTGDVDIEDGTLKVASTDNLGTGKVSLEGGELEISTDTTVTNEVSSSDDDSAIDTGPNAVSISGTVSGSNKINKVGTGTLTLTGSLNNTGGLDVTGGTLVTNGTGVTPVAVTSGTLQGSGTIGSLTSNSFVEPGNSIGTLNVAGNVTLNSGSTLVIEINANGTSDKIIATGSASLGGTLRISPEAGSYTAGSEYTFITASSISGTFSNVVLLSCSSEDSISATYGSSSVTVTLSGCSISATNESEIKSYVNDLSAGASGDLSAVITTLNNLTGTEYDTAINQLDYDRTAAISSVGQHQLSQINSIVEQQINTISVPHKLSFDASGEPQIKSVWGQTYGAFGTQKAESELGINGYSYNFSGLTIGSNPYLGNGNFGAAASMLMGKVRSDGGEGESQYTSVALTGYVVHDLQSENQLITTLSFATDFIKSERNLSFGTIDRKASASYRAYTLDMGLNFTTKASPLVTGILTTDISSGLTLNYQEGFTETGADSLNLNVRSKRNGIFRLGVNQTYAFQNEAKNGAISPYLTWGINGSRYLNSPDSVQGFQGQESFTITTAERNNFYGVVGFGVTKDLSNRESFGLSARQKIAKGFSETSATVYYQFRF